MTFSSIFKMNIYQVEMEGKNVKGKEDNRSGLDGVIIKYLHVII